MRSAMPTQLSSVPLTAARARCGWACHAFRYANSVVIRSANSGQALCGWARHAFRYANSVVIRSAISGQGPWWVGVSRVPLCQVSFVTRSANSGQALCGWARHAFRYAKSVLSRDPLTAARAHGGWACHAFR